MVAFCVLSVYTVNILVHRASCSSKPAGRGHEKNSTIEKYDRLDELDSWTKILTNLALFSFLALFSG